MPKYIDADAFVKENREWYCEQCEKRKGMKRGKLRFVYEIGGVPCRACDVDDMISDIEDFPAADVEPKQRWIPVMERLPKAECGEGQSVLTVDVCGEQRVLYFDGGNWCWPTGEALKTSRSFPVTHWMPLPEPPKENPDDK